MSINPLSSYQSRLGYGQTSANTYNSGYGVNSAVSPPPIQIHRFPGFPAGASGTSAFPQATDNWDLLKYRVASSNLMDAKTRKDLQPDQNGVYTRLNADGSKNYFIRMANGDIYQVGKFDPRTMTWQVLDPQTGQAIAILDRPGKKGNKWLVVNKPPLQERQQSREGQETQGGREARGTQGASGTQGGGGARGGRGAQRGQPNTQAAEQDNSGLRGKLVNAFQAARETVKSAMGELGKRWDTLTAGVMGKLYGHDIFTQEGRNALMERFKGTYQALTSTINSWLGNVGIGQTSPGVAAHAVPATGSMVFNPEAIRNMSPEKLKELVIHEASHIGAGTNDESGYLTPSNDRRPNLRRSLAANTFLNNVNNADHVARAATILSTNPSRREAFV